MRQVGGSETVRNVLLDVNNLLYRAYFAFVDPRLKAERHNEENPHQRIPVPPAKVCRLPTDDGGLHGMDLDLVLGSLKILTSWLYDISKPTRIIAFFDGVPARRSALFPEYKKRDKDEAKQAVYIETGTGPAALLRDGTKVHGPVSLLAHLFRLVGCDVYHHPDEEADDLIASFVRAHPENINIIVSSDKDFFQLVSDRTVVYRPGPETPRIHDAERVADRMEKLYKVRVGPDRIRMFKALTGDSSDGIDGIFRLRKKVAAPLCHLGSVAEVYETGLPGFSREEKTKALALRDQIELNYKLVGFYDQLDLSAALRPEAGNFALAREILCEDLSVTDVDLSPFRVGKYAVRTTFKSPDWLADV